MLTLLHYVRSVHTILLNPKALFRSSSQQEWRAIYRRCQLSSSFDGVLVSGLFCQGSGKRRTVTIAQEVKGPVAIDLHLSAEDSNS